jgi:NitT/TauT family transport system ATP-binding protein
MDSGTEVRAGQKAGVAAPASAGAATLQVKDVAKVFESARGNIEAVRDVTFDVPSGKFVALIGPSGCGKSTMLRIISGIYPASAGQVLIGDAPVTGPRRDVGLVFQSPNLLPWRTIAKNVALPLEVGGRSSVDAGGRAEHYLRMVGLYDFRDKLPAELSGGMQQRAGIVRALVHDPTILLMDEPFGAVDVLTREKLNFEIQALWEQTKKTIVFVTHSIPEAVFLSDTIFVFSPRPGTIVKVVDVDLPRPRTRHTMYTHEFEGYTNLVREYVRE